MERLTIATTFQKSIDLLKNTECSQKEKLALFTQIADCIESPALRSNVNYLSHVSSALTILLMFCEELDSVTRMSAEENLYRIIRFSTPLNIVRIQYDLFHEIKKNGNERSLRISLHLFGYYCHLIKLRKAKPYAINLLPCILSISKRREQQLIETLSEFLQKFCKHLQMCLNENEVVKLMEVFIGDAVTSECVVKQRCSAANVILFIENSRRPDVMVKNALTKCLDILVKDYTSTNIVGALGLLRLLLPVLQSPKKLQAIVINKIIEIYELCLHLLNDPSHTIINASLECLNVILSDPRPKLKSYLNSLELKHMEILHKRKSLKNQIFKRKSSTSSIEMTRSKNSLFSSFPTSPAIFGKTDKDSKTKCDEIENSKLNKLSDDSCSGQTTDDKALLTCSDIELDSFKTNDFIDASHDTDKGYDSSTMQSPVATSSQRKQSLIDTVSLKSQKSTESIGSFFNSILTHPNTESVSKFFRVGSSTPTDSVPTTPKYLRTQQDTHLIRNSQDADNVSVISLSSQISVNSSFDLINRMDESLPEIEILTDQDIDAIKLDVKNSENDHFTIPFEQSNATTSQIAPYRELFIGNISDQPLLHYTVRLIASKFLLAGTPNQLIDDRSVRVSIKNLSLAVIGHCVCLCPFAIRLPLEKCHNLKLAKSYDTSDESDNSSSDTVNIIPPNATLDDPNKCEGDTGEQLVIKDDHFGETSAMTGTYFDFVFPLSKSADNVLLSQLKSNESAVSSARSEKLNTDLTELLSKSDIVDSNRTFRSFGTDSATSSNLKYVRPKKHKQIESIYDYTNDEIEVNQEQDQQLIEDILLFWNHSDPILRTDVQIIIGNFLFTHFNDFLQYGEYSHKETSYKLLHTKFLLEILLNGLSDETHMVVKQSIASIENILPILLKLKKNSTISNALNANDTNTPNTEIGSQLLSLACLSDLSSNAVEYILEELLLVYNNKYWVVRNKYCEFASKLNYSQLKLALGEDMGEYFENRFLSHIYAMLKDTDHRIRNGAADAICDHIKILRTTNLIEIDKEHSYRHLLNDLISERIFMELPFPLYQLGDHLVDDNMKMMNEQNLCECLFTLSNMLLELECKEQQCGVIKSILKLIEIYSPIGFGHIWNEFNVLELCMSLLNQNYSTGIDLSCQCDLIHICASLLAGKISIEISKIDKKTKTLTSSLLIHILKLLNIYYYSFTHQRPVFIPKGQKVDIFINSKELQMLHSYGYFGNDYFYLKIYKLIKLQFDSYKITITDETDAKLLALLKQCLQSLALLLEILSSTEDSVSIKLIEEILMYLTTFLHLVPTKCIFCIKQLLKYMFCMTFSNRHTQYAYFIESTINEKPTNEIYEKLKEFKEFNENELVQTEALTTKTGGTKLLGVLPTNSNDEKHQAVIGHGNIKLFEPIVIQCLKLFTKSNSKVQSIILDMLCQVLEFNVSYCLLDANNIFIDFILKLLELIETGTVKNSHIVIPNIIKFLFYLSKQKEKNVVTIPKIINITDTLLANSVTQNGCTEALKELAYEFFFQQNYHEDNSVEGQLNVKELCTQKEVAFSMLLKFIDDPTIQKIICLILLKEKQNLKEIKSELHGTLLQIIIDNKPVITDIESYKLFDQLFESIKPNVMSDIKNIEKLLTVFFKYTELNSFHELSVLTIILDHIIIDVEENVLLNSIVNLLSDQTDQLHSAEYLVEPIRFKIISFLTVSDNNNEISIYEFNTSDELHKLFTIFQRFIKSLKKVFLKYHTILAHYKSSANLDATVLDKAFQFLERPSIIFSSLSIQEKIDEEKLNILKEIWKLHIEFCGDKNQLVKQLKKMDGLTNGNPTNLKMRAKNCLLTILLKHPLNTSDVEFLLENYFFDLISFDDGQQFIVISCAVEAYSLKILTKLEIFLNGGRTHSMNESRISLNIIEHSNDTVVSHAVRILLTKFLTKSKTISPVLLAQAAKILAKILNKLVSVDSEEHHEMELFATAVTDEVIEMLRGLKRDYEKTEMYKFCAEPVHRIIQIYENTDDDDISGTAEILTSAPVLPIDENWFLKQVEYNAYMCQVNKESVCEILAEIKSESKLRTIFESSEFDRSILSKLIEYSFDCMTAKFKQDCFQYNPHMNYLKIPLILKQAICSIINDIELICKTINRNTVDHFITKDVKETANAVFVLMNCIDRLENQCLIYVEAQFVEKFFRDNLLKASHFDRFISLSNACLLCAQSNLRKFSIGKETDVDILDDILLVCKCVDAVLRQRHIIGEININLMDQNQDQFIELLVDVVYNLIAHFLASKNFIRKYSLKHVMSQQNRRNKQDTETETKYAKAIFIGKFIECYYSSANDENIKFLTSNTFHLIRMKDSLLSLAILTLRIDFVYFFAVTPYEILINFDWNFDDHDPNKSNRLPALPIDYLNEAEMIEKFVKRINIFGFPSRQYFEEFFMSLLLLINKKADFNIVDAQEQNQIKSICLTAIIELMVSCKMFTNVGNRNCGKFHHIPRLPRLKSDAISMKKLHKIQSSFLPEPIVFYLSNLERNLTGNIDNIIGSHTFLPNQCELNVIWHIIEEQQFSTVASNVSLKNMHFFIDKSVIDVKSSVQVIFDVFTQLLEENYSIVLPHLAKFCELCENREQFRWIKNVMTKLQESIHMENAICHEHIIYCLCKSHAILVPSMSELNHLCGIISTYLKSTHLFVRTATLKGLLCLLESSVKTNTTIGGLSEEILTLRTLIISYITKHGIIEESDEHTILVWTLNFYLIEVTSTFIADCNLLSNSIISANNILKRTINLEQYLCILHGLERLVITNITPKYFREKIEKITLDLVKLENENFSIAALKLLVTCMYMGCAEQLENTERSNGIVQDEPEIIIQTTEKIDILFNRIKLSTIDAAHIYGNVLCQLTNDLVPPKEVLTKVIKELLTISQPHCEVIAKIVFQVFRSAIDSSYLALLQDWLICSLPNFLIFPIEKTVWCLTVIFISASINLNLIKIFPEVLAKYNEFIDIGETNTLRSMPNRMFELFCISCNDFYYRLTEEQKTGFRDIFASSDSDEIKSMLKSL